MDWWMWISIRRYVKVRDFSDGAALAGSKKTAEESFIFGASEGDWRAESASCLRGAAPFRGGPVSTPLMYLASSSNLLGKKDRKWP